MNCQGFMNTNLYSMATAPWSQGGFAFCHLRGGLVQALSLAKDNYIRDMSGGTDRPRLNGWCLRFNGTNNHLIGDGIYIEGGKPIKMRFHIKADSHGNYINWLDTQGWAPSHSKGIALSPDAGNADLRILIGNGNTNFEYFTGMIIEDAREYDIIFTWSGIAGDEATVFDRISGETKSVVVGQSWTGNSLYPITVGRSARTANYYFQGDIYDIDVEVNNKLIFSFSADQQVFYDGNKVLGNIQGHLYEYANPASYKFTERPDILYPRTNMIGYATSTALPGLIIPLTNSFAPVLSADTVYRGGIPFNVDFYADAFEANGTDNYIDTDLFHNIADGLHVEALIKLKFPADTRLVLFSSGHSFALNEKGTWFDFYKSGTNYTIRILTGDGTNFETIETASGFYPTSDYFKINIDWSGVIGDDYTIKIDDVIVYTFQPTITWAGDSDNNIFFLNYGNSTTFPFSGEIAYLKFNQMFIPFVGKSSTVYDVNSNTPFTIGGTVYSTAWKLQNKYNYFENKGFSYHDWFQLLVNNSIDNGTKVQANSYIDLEGTFMFSNIGAIQEIFVTTSNYSDKGFKIFLLADQRLCIRIGDGTTNGDYLILSDNLQYNTKYDIRIWGNLTLGSTISCTVDGVLTEVIVDLEWSGESDYTLRVGALNAGWPIDYYVFNYSYTINGNPPVHEVLDRNFDVSKIIGTITPGQWGYNYKTPASQLDDGKDVLGGDLTNPHRPFGINGGSSYMQHSDALELTSADKGNKWFHPGFDRILYTDFNDGTLQGWVLNVDGGSNTTIINDNNQLKISQSVNGTQEARPRINNPITLTATKRYKYIFVYRNADAMLRGVHDGSSLIDINEHLVGNGVFEFEVLQDSDNDVNIFFNGKDYLNNITIDNIYVVDLDAVIPIEKKMLTIGDIIPDYGSYSFANILNDTWKQEILMYNYYLPDEDKNKVIECYARTLLPGTCLVTYGGEIITYLPDMRPVTTTQCP